MFFSPLYFLFASIIAIALVISNALDINRAFKTIDEGLVTSSRTVIDRNTLLRDSVAQLGTFGQQQQLTGVYAFKDEYCNYLHQIKTELARKVGGTSEAVGILKDPDNTTIPTEILIENHKADSILQKIIILKEVMQTTAYTDDAKKSIAGILSTKTFNGNWAYDTFGKVPATAVLTILEKLENDANVAEQILLSDILYSQNLSSKPATAQ